MVSISKLSKADCQYACDKQNLSGLPDPKAKVDQWREFVRTNIPPITLEQIFKEKVTEQKLAINSTAIPSPAIVKEKKKIEGQFQFSHAMYDDIIQRIEILEQRLNSITITGIPQGYGMSSKNVSIKSYSIKELLDNLAHMIRRNPDSSRWVKIDAFYNNLQIYGNERDEYDKILLNLYYDEKIELAEASESQHIIRSRGMQFGRITLKKEAR